MTAPEWTTDADVTWESTIDPNAGPAVPTAKPRRCKHAHRERRPMFDAAGAALPYTFDVCTDCGHAFDPGVVRRNRNNGKRGKKIERERNAQAGIENRGALNRSEDGGGAADPIVQQSKSGPSWWPRRLVAALDALDVRAEQMPVVVITETPGPGRRARVVALVNYADLLRVVDASRTIADDGDASRTAG
jgi:hypothetical protein